MGLRACLYACVVISLACADNVGFLGALGIYLTCGAACIRVYWCWNAPQTYVCFNFIQDLRLAVNILWLVFVESLAIWVRR